MAYLFLLNKEEDSVGTLLGYEFNNINDNTNNLMVKDDNWELIQLGLLLLNSYPSNVLIPPIRTSGCIQGCGSSQIFNVFASSSS